jgi:hypothetical protein
MSSGKKTKKPIVNNVPSIPVSATAARPEVKISNDNVLNEEVLRWILALLCTLFVYWCIAGIVQKVYHPDASLSLAEAKRVLIEPEGARPEPMEAMLFRVGVIVITLGLLAFYWLFSRMKLIKEMAAKPLFLIISILPVALLVLMIWLDFTAQNPFVKDGGDMVQNSRDFVGKTNFDFYFDGFFLGKYMMLYTFLLVPALACLFFFGIRKFSWEENKIYKTTVAAIGYLVLGGVIIACVGMSVFYFPYSFENKYNFNAVYYSMTQVYAGIPMLVNGFSNTYGLYPHFLNLIFQVIGLSVYKFSLVMGIFIGLSFIANFYSLKQYVNNKVILFLGILTVIFFPFLNFKFGQNFDCNFAFYPIRYIIPSTLIFLSTIYFKKGSKGIYWTTTVVLSFFVLWNPEIGLVSYLSWLAVNTFRDFYTSENKINVKKILIHWLVGAGMLVVAFYIYKLLITATYGSSPDLSSLFSTITVFSKVGAGLLPMSLVHPWNLVALIVLLGMTYSISKWYKKEITAKTSMVFLLSVLSVGFFVYFEGRSHNWQLAQSSCMSLLLLTVLGDDLWRIVKNKNVLALNALFVVFLFVISFSFFEIVAGTDRISELVSQDDDKTKQQEEQNRVESNNEFILKNSKPKENIYVFTVRQLQALYFDGNKRKSAFNPGLGDFFLKSDLDILVNQVRDSSFNIFLEPNLAAYNFLIRPFAAMAATYDVKDTNKSMILLVKRKNKLPTQAFFNRPEQQVFYRKYTDDTAGLNARINDGAGQPAANLNPEFSAQVLFRPQRQAYQYATLVGDMNDSSGFIIANVLNSSNYFFGINGKGTGAAIPGDDWAYVVMNVYPDHFEVYVNGNLASTFPLPKPFKSSPEKLFVGNLGFMRFYIGQISEVAITNKAVDKGQIQTTWDTIKQATTNK